MANPPASAASERDLWRKVSGGDAAPPDYDAKTMSLVAVSARLEKIPRNDALIAITRELRTLVLDGLRSAAGPDEWLAYWDRDRWITFVRLNKALASLLHAAYASEDERQRAIDDGDRASRSLIAEKLPELATPIEGAEERITTACRLIATFKALQAPMLRTVDMDCAMRLSSSIYWFGIVMSSLAVACEHEDVRRPGMIEFFSFMAGVTSTAALKAARAAADLRRVSPQEHLLLNATIEPAHDGVGWVASIRELDLETCGETHAEMNDLLRSAVTVYFAGEKKRGTLRRTLSELQIEGSPTRLVVSLYVQDGGDTALSDVMSLEL